MKTKLDRTRLRTVHFVPLTAFDSAGKLNLATHSGKRRVHTFELDLVIASA